MKLEKYALTENSSDAELVSAYRDGKQAEKAGKELAEKARDILVSRHGICSKPIKVGKVTFTLSVIKTKEGVGVDTAKVKAVKDWKKLYGKPTGGDLRLTIK